MLNMFLTEAFDVIFLFRTVNQNNKTFKKET